MTMKDKIEIVKEMDDSLFLFTIFLTLIIFRYKRYILYIVNL